MKPFRLLDVILITMVVLIGVSQLYVSLGNNRGVSARSVSSDSIDASFAKAPAPIPPTKLVPMGGEVVLVESDAIVIKGQSGSEERIGVSPQTVIVRQGVGVRKDSALIEQEINAFHEEYRKLAEHPEKNHDALTSLIAPSPFVETNISLVDIKQGDRIAGLTVQESGNLSVVRMMVMESGNGHN